MEKLTRIQMAVFLQQVELFSYCSAEQMVRLASIAQEQHLAASELIYAEGEPATALYCVVSGEVLLSGRDGDASRRVGSAGTFGVREILSDRLRRERALAEQTTAVLVFSADDFFDLLSNNIEIVKALFRRLLRPTQEHSALSAELPAEQSVPVGAGAVDGT